MTTFWNVGLLLRDYAALYTRRMLLSCFHSFWLLSNNYLTDNLLFLFMSMEWDSVWTVAISGAIVHLPDDTWVWGATVEWFWQWKPNKLEKILSQFQFDHHKFHIEWSSANPALRGDRQATNCLNHSTDFLMTIVFLICWFCLKVPSGESNGWGNPGKCSLSIIAFLSYEFFLLNEIRKLVKTLKWWMYNYTFLGNA
jgi:hypothetical protein